MSKDFYCERCDTEIDEEQHNLGQGLCLDCEVELMEEELENGVDELPDVFDGRSFDDIKEFRGDYDG